MADQLRQVVNEANSNLEIVQESLAPLALPCPEKSGPERIDTSAAIVEFTHPTCEVNVDLGFFDLNDNPEVAKTLKFLERQKGYHIFVVHQNGDESEVSIQRLRLRMFIFAGRSRLDEGHEHPPWWAGNCLFALKANFYARLLAREADGHLVDRSGEMRALREICVQEKETRQLFAPMNADEYEETEREYKKRVLKDGLEKVRRLPACIKK